MGDEMSSKSRLATFASSVVAFAFLTFSGVSDAATIRLPAPEGATGLMSGGPAGLHANTLASCVKVGKESPYFMRVRAESDHYTYHDDVTGIQGIISVRFPNMPSQCSSLVHREVDVRLWYRTTGLRLRPIMTWEYPTGEPNPSIPTPWFSLCPMYSDLPNDCPGPTYPRFPSTRSFNDRWYHTSRYGKLIQVKAIARVRLLDPRSEHRQKPRYFSIRKMKVRTVISKRLV